MGDEDDDTFQLIRQAILFENEELLMDLISANPSNLEMRDESGRSPLMLAAHNGRLKALQILLHLAPDSLNYRSTVNGKTALHLACEGGEKGAVALLLTAGADPAVTDRNGYCALEVAHIAGNSAIASLLIDAIQAEESRVESMHTNLLAATVDGDVQLMEEILKGEKKKERILNGKKGRGVLFVGCENGRLEGVQLLLSPPFRQLNGLVDENSGDSILHAAISSQNLLLVRMILENYPTLSSKSNKEGASILHWAVRSRNVDIVDLLLEFPFPEYALIQVDNHSVNYRFAFDLNSGDGECRTALYLSVLQSDVNILTSLLAMTLPMDDGTTRCPFLVDVYCSKGRTPLMVAARNNNLQLISILLSHGADINLPLAILDDNETRAAGSGALLEAARGDSIEVAQLLLSKGALDTDNRALRMGVGRKSEGIVMMLLGRLAFPDTEIRVNKRNLELGQMEIGESLLPSYLCPSKGVMINWSSACLSSLLPQWISAAAMHVNTRMRTTTLSFGAITRVDLSQNKLELFPPLLWQLPSLRILNLSHNQLTTIEVPSGYLYSSSIESLLLSHNAITSIPPALITLLPSLGVFDISHNELSYLPDTIWMSSSLKEVNASSNAISALPSAYSMGARSIESGGETRRENNQMKTTTRRINRRSQWQNELGLSVVEDEEGDESRVSSHTLTTLNLSHNKFRMFPTSLACTSPRLVSLSLAHNHLTTVAAITALPAMLKSLDVSHNSLTQIFSPNDPMGECHAGMGGMRGGRRSSPNRQSRSRSKSAIRTQRALSVSRNGEAVGGREVCIHRRHAILSHLKTLNISGNKLKTIVLSRGEIVLTPSLATLDASENEIAELDGVSLSRLTALCVLSLSGNPLSTLPPQLGLLSRLWSLSLKECPLIEPLLSIARAENAKTIDVLAHLRGILEESKTFPHLKLFILGGNGVGKSTIADAIKGEGNGVKHVVIGRCARTFRCKLPSKKLSAPITFSVWDASGETEVRPLQEYAFCRRAIYMVVFRVSEGTEALHSLSSFLLSIQQRTPNASVVLVGTHVDQLAAGVHDTLISDLELSIKKRFLSGEGDKQGLPRIVDLLFVSLKKKNDIRVLMASIVSAGEESRMGKELTLTQPIPHSYICLLAALGDVYEERKKRGKNGLISQSALLDVTKEGIKRRLGRYLRDETEVSLGVLFARDAGWIIRVEDSSSAPLVFLDPLALIDTLSLVLTIRSGKHPQGVVPAGALASLKELSWLSPHLLPLLHKYSVAVSCHSNLLLLPSLLPDEFTLRADLQGRVVEIEAKSPSTPSTPITRVNWSTRVMNVVRMYSTVYVPNGLWPRLIARLTWDETISRVMGMLVKHEGMKWTVWENGAELRNGKERMIVVKEFFLHADPSETNLHALEWRMKTDGKWRDVDLSPNRTIIVSIRMVEKEEREEMRLWTKIVSLIVDAIDYLLEDWFPSLGTRFVHSSQGELLVKRLVICPSCSPFTANVEKRRLTKDDWDAGEREEKMENGGRIKSRSKTVSELSTIHSAPISTFSIEECMEAARIESKKLECPHHGVVSLQLIAPDVAFLDIDSHHALSETAIKRGRLIGRGAFGFVFRAYIKSAGSMQPVEIAQKMMEPCEPGLGARQSAVNEYKAIESKWERDSLEYSTRAYLSCRQEMSLLGRLSHPNTLTLIGMTTSPLSIIVEMAPLGSLRSLLTSFRKSASKLSIGTLTQSCVQVSKALEYLHSNNIIYRDLKSENVLAWRFPPPFCQGEVHLKLGDYGISRLVQPWGEWKGFGGTEGFMAPEIVKSNGEEEYSMKVDVFSFGMFLYELLTLKLPFEKEDHVKEKMVDGGRPLLMGCELLWPCSILDVLSSCWHSSPLSRPSSSQLVSLSTAPEFSHLIDTMILSSMPKEIVIRHPEEEDGEEAEDANIWMIYPSSIDIIACTVFGWVECTSLPMDRSWEGGRVYSRESNDWMWKVSENNEISLVPFNLTPPIPVTMPQLDSHPLIASPLALSPSLFLLPSKYSLHLLTRSISPSSPLSTLPSFSLLESLTSPFEILSFVLLPSPQGRQIWTAHADGIITAHFISGEERFSFSSSFSHPPGCSLPIGKLVANKDGSVVWSYLTGCSRIFCWDGAKRTLSAQLDMRKVQPASETIHTIETDSTSHISSMCLFERGSSPSLLFVGTVEGSLIILSSLTLQPFTACRPYSGPIGTMVIVDCRNGEETAPGSRTTSSEGALGWMRERVERLRASPSNSFTQSNHLLLTIGKGFRNLVDRFVSQNQAKDDIVAALWRIDDWTN